MRKKVTVKDTKAEAASEAPKARRAKAPSAKKQVEQKIETVGLHNLKPPVGSHQKRKLKGRGSSSGHGKTSTRGSKGQTSRAGRDFYLGFEGGQTPLIRRIPKRGFTSKFQKIYQIVNLESIKRIKDATVTPEVLLKKGLIKSRSLPVKILGDGEIKDAKTFKVHAFSKSAEEKIKKAGGAIEVLNA